MQIENYIVESQVKDNIEFLDFEGYIQSVGNEYPTLAITNKANTVLFNNETIVMKQAKPKVSAKKNSKKEKTPERIDRSLFADLKALRRELADENNVPAYIVFSDATLIDMCKKLPTTTEELFEVSGVGKVKLELYGDRFLKILKSYCNYSKKSDSND